MLQVSLFWLRCRLKKNKVLVDDGLVEALSIILPIGITLREYNPLAIMISYSGKKYIFKVGRLCRNPKKKEKKSKH